MEFEDHLNVYKEKIEGCLDNSCFIPKKEAKFKHLKDSDIQKYVDPLLTYISQKWNGMNDKEFLKEGIDKGYHKLARGELKNGDKNSLIRYP